jgi:hypothetical protein
MSVFQRWLSWIIGVAAIAAYFPRFRHGGGSAIFSAAADCILHGQTPRHCDDLIYAYPPLFALLWTPFVPIPLWLRVVVWYLVVVATIFASLRLCEMLARRLFPGEWSVSELAALRILTVLLNLKFILAVLENQAYDSVALVFILVGLLALTTERWLLGAASLATAAALKVTPLIFLPYLVFKGRFAAAGVFTVILILLSLLPDILLPPHEQWHVTAWLRDVILAPFNVHPGFDLPFWVTDSPMNQTFRAAVVRLFTGVHQSQPFMVVFDIMQSRAFGIALYGVMGLYILVVGFVLLKTRQHNGLVAVDGAVLVVSALLLTPVSSQSHFVGLMLPYALLAAWLIKDRSMRVFNAANLLLSYVLATATSNDLVGRSFTGWALWNSLPVWGTLVLVVPLAVLIWSRRARQPGEQTRESPPADVNA